MNKDMNYPWMIKGEMRVRSWTWIKRSNIEEDQYSWTRVAHKEGEQAHELGCSHLICHIHVLACICISFQIYICNACVRCMLVIELD